jgi:hypothetical protein
LAWGIYRILFLFLFDWCPSGLRLDGLRRDGLAREVGTLRFAHPTVCETDTKIAVNARGCNAAALLSFGRRMIAESPWNRYRFATSHHAVVTAGFLTGIAKCRRHAPIGIGGVNEG